MQLKKKHDVIVTSYAHILRNHPGDIAYRDYGFDDIVSERF